MSNYEKGARFEHAVMKDLERRGYVLRSRSAGSHGEADIIAVKDGRAIAVQCKTDGRLGVAEWNRFYDVCTDAGAVPIMASKPYRGCIAYYRLTGRKDGKRRRQPMEGWSDD